MVNCYSFVATPEKCFVKKNRRQPSGLFCSTLSLVKSHLQLRDLRRMLTSLFLQQGFHFLGGWIWKTLRFGNKISKNIHQTCSDGSFNSGSLYVTVCHSKKLFNIQLYSAPICIHLLWSAWLTAPLSFRTITCMFHWLVHSESLPAFVVLQLFGILYLLGPSAQLKAPEFAGDVDAKASLRRHSWVPKWTSSGCSWSQSCKMESILFLGGASSHPWPGQMLWHAGTPWYLAVTLSPHQWEHCHECQGSSDSKRIRTIWHYAPKAFWTKLLPPNQNVPQNNLVRHPLESIWPQNPFDLASSNIF